MPGRRIDGRALAQRFESEVRAAVDAARAPRRPSPQLDIVVVGEDPASQIYVRRKEEACARVGIATKVHRLPASSTPDEVAKLLDALNLDPMVTGVLLQLPLPTGFEAGPLVAHIDPQKDVDGLHPESLGRVAEGMAPLAPATPQAVLAILDAEQVALKGVHVVIVNHSNLVGRPLALLLLQRDATVTVCHKFTRDLAFHTRQADVLVSATGVPGLITAKHVKPGAVVIDVGIARQGDKIQGDVAFDEVAAVASALTPVPGGVGPMTVAMLLSNVMAAYDLQRAAGAKPR